MEIEASQINVGGGKILLIDLLDYLYRNNLSCDVWLGYSDMKLEIDQRYNGFFSTHKTSILQTIRRYFKRRSGVLYFCSLPPYRYSSSSLTYIHNSHLLTSAWERIKKCSDLAICCKGILMHYWLRLCINNTPYLGCQLETIQNILRNDFGKEALLLPFFHFPPQQERREQYDFCYVALPYAHKNHHNLLKSIEILESQQVSFTIALTIPKEDSLGLYTLIEELSTRLRYVKLTNLGMLSRQEVFSLYAMSRFLIFPSLLETLGLPLIEAAHCGTKVLASNLYFAHQSLEGVITFNPEDVNDIASTMKRALQGEYTHIEQRIKVKNKITEIVQILNDEYPG